MTDLLPFLVGFRSFVRNPTLVCNLGYGVEHEIAAGIDHGIHDVLDRRRFEKFRRRRFRLRAGRYKNEHDGEKNPR